jgi:hypothetical protein
MDQAPFRLNRRDLNEQSRVLSDSKISHFDVDHFRNRTCSLSRSFSQALLQRMAGNPRDLFASVTITWMCGLASGVN